MVNAQHGAVSVWTSRRPVTRRGLLKGRCNQKQKLRAARTEAGWRREVTDDGSWVRSTVTCINAIT